MRHWAGVAAVALAMIATLAPAQVQAQEEDVRVRGTLPHMLAQGETNAQLAQRIARTIGVLDRRIAPPCGMRRVFDISAAEQLDVDDLSRPAAAGRPSVWRITVYGKGCWATRLHNVFLFPRGNAPASLRAGVPGRTVAGIKHQQSATQLVLRQANGIAMRFNCGAPAFLVDSEVTTPRRPGKGWTETWSAKACDYTRRFTVMFAPLEGTQMRVSAVLAD